MIRPSRSDRSRRSGFTLVELLVVITILGILVALLVPVIASAVRTANEARVAGEINTLAQALASFKNKYGDFPPSRIILCENGFYDINNAAPLGKFSWYSGLGYSFNSIGGEVQYIPSDVPDPKFFSPDLTYGQLAQRSLRYLRKFFPRATFSTTGPLFSIKTPYPESHDFNGNGQFDEAPILLQGHECLVFFLGGIPSIEGNAQLNGLTGFSNNPKYPFVTEYHLGAPVATNRSRPLFEFPNDRLIDDDRDGIPGYIDTLGTLTTGRYFVYFSSYGGGGYDPNDVNFNLSVDEDLPPAVRFRPFRVNFLSPNLTSSPLPNPYTSSLPAPTSNPASYINGATYQILSAGGDRQYGLGGQYLPNNPTDRLPTDVAVGDRGLRNREQDNLSNFATGRLD